mgnify:CR=1 FL=1
MPLEAARPDGSGRIDQVIYVARDGHKGIVLGKKGETAKAIVVKAPDSDVSEADIIAYAKERLATFKCPTSVEWTDMLPRNPSGKVLKKDLREPFWEGHDRRVG